MFLKIKITNKTRDDVWFLDLFLILFYFYFEQTLKTHKILNLDNKKSLQRTLKLYSICFQKLFSIIVLKNKNQIDLNISHVFFLKNNIF